MTTGFAFTLGTPGPSWWSSLAKRPAERMAGAHFKGPKSPVAALSLLKPDISKNQTSESCVDETLHPERIFS